MSSTVFLKQSMVKNKTQQNNLKLPQTNTFSKHKEKRND